MPQRPPPPVATFDSHCEIAVELEGVTFGYDRRRPVLKGIDMRIPRGKVVAIMGASGSGKTTILRLIGGQIRPQAGRVVVAGQSVAGPRPRRPLCAAPHGSACCSSSARCSPT